LKRQTWNGKKEVKGVGKELSINFSSGQGTKRKQARTPQPHSGKEDQILMAESGHNAMALIVASPSVQFTTAKGCLDLDIVLDGEDDEMAKKMRIASSSDAVGSAEAAGQPRREP